MQARSDVALITVMLIGTYSDSRCCHSFDYFHTCRYINWQDLGENFTHFRSHYSECWYAIFTGPWKSALRHFCEISSDHMRSAIPQKGRSDAGDKVGEIWGRDATITCHLACTKPQFHARGSVIPRNRGNALSKDRFTEAQGTTWEASRSRVL